MLSSCAASAAKQFASTANPYAARALSAYCPQWISTESKHTLSIRNHSVLQGKPDTPFKERDYQGTLVGTRHPCHPLIKGEIVNGMTVSDEVRAVQNGILEMWRQLRPEAPPYRLWSWAGKESDRTPNQPAVILSSVAMDIEFMCKNIVQEDLSGLNITKKTHPALWDSLEQSIQSAQKLNTLSRLLAARDVIDQLDSPQSAHYEKQFFSDFTANEYMTKKKPFISGLFGKDTPDRHDIMGEIEHCLGELNEINDHYLKQLEISGNSRLTDIRKKHQSIPFYLNQTQGRLPADEVHDTAIALLKCCLGAAPSEDETKRCVQLQSFFDRLNSDASFLKQAQAKISQLTPEQRNTCDFYTTYKMLGDRVANVALANCTSASDIVSAMCLAKLAQIEPGDRFTVPLPLFEDIDSCNAVPDTLSDLLKWPPYDTLCQENGAQIFYAMSDMTLSSGTGPGREAVRQSMSAVTERLLIEHPELGVYLQLGQGSRADRGLFSFEASEGQTIFPLPHHPSTSVGFTWQSGPGFEGRLPHLPGHLLDLQEAQDPDQWRYLHNYFSPKYRDEMTAFHAPGLDYYRQQMSANSPFMRWLNSGNAKDAVQDVLNLQPGSRFSQTIVTPDFSLLNLRAISTGAILKRVGVPALGLFPLHGSLSSSINQFDTQRLAYEYYTELYGTNPNFRRAMNEVRESLYLWHQPTMQALNPPYELEQRLIEQFEMCTHFIEETSNKPLINPIESTNNKRHTMYSDVASPLGLMEALVTDFGGSYA